jgi:hypothetical protein
MQSKADLYLAHPVIEPPEVGPIGYLIHPPSVLAPSSAFIMFREKTLLPMLESRPADLYLLGLLEKIEAALKWREALAPELRFWRAD